MTHAAQSDVALLRRLTRAGDADAFDALYRRHTPVLYATALRLTADPDSAADIVHDAWVRAVESADRFAGRSSLRTWLTGILVNCHRERLRVARRESPEGNIAGRDTFDLASASPLDPMAIDPLDLDSAIAALPPGYREVFVLHDIEGFTHEEIAAMLGLVAGTSKSQLARARRRVREWLHAGAPRPA